MKTLAYVSLAFALLFYGLLFLWLSQLASVGGINNVPKMLISLEWDAVVYGLGLIILGTSFLCLGAALASRKQ